MTRRRLLLLSAVLLASLIGVGVYLLLPPKPGVTLENFRRLHKSMLLEDAEAFLGSHGVPDEAVVDDRIEYWWEEHGESVCLIVNGHQVVLQGYYINRDNKIVSDLWRSPQTLSQRFRYWVKDWTGW